MRLRLWLGLIGFAVLASGCPRRTETGLAPEPYLLVWAGDADRKQDDFLAVIGAEPGRHYGEVLKTYPVRSRGNEPGGLLEFERRDRRMFATGILSGRVFVFDLSDPLQGRLLRTIEPSSDRMLTSPMEATTLSNGDTVVVCNDRVGYRGEALELFAAPGGLLRLDGNGNGAREFSAAHPTARSLVKGPTGISASGRARILATTGGTQGLTPTAATPATPGIAVQVWKTPSLEVEATMTLPVGPRGEENLGPRRIRFLRGKPYAYTATHEGGALYYSDSVANKDKVFQLVHDFGKDSLPGDFAVTPDDRYLVQALTGKNEVALLDIYNNIQPKVLSTARFDSDPANPGRSRKGGPAAVAVGSEGARVAVADYTIDVPGDKLDGDHRVYMLRIDRETKQLQFDKNFRDENTDEVGIDFNRTKWPHGDTGPARPRAVLFVSPLPRE